MLMLMKRPRNLSGLIATAALVLLAPGAQLSRAVTFDFEEPTYTTGALIGQDNWVQNAYVGTPNGTVVVSSTAPLSGAQSISYTQTSADLLGDVGRSGAILVPEIQGTDVTLSYIIKATTGLSGPNGGIFLGNGAPGGASPIFARINGGVVEVGSAGAIVPINSFFFLEGETLKMTYEIDFNVGSMNLILDNLDVPGSPVSGVYPFFAPYGAPTGPNGEYVVDMGVFLRGGNVQVDDIEFTLGVGPIETDFEWTATGSGNWNQNSNWTPQGVPGTLPGRQSVTLGSSITSTQTIYNNAARNLNSLTIDNSNSYIVAGPGSLSFQSDTSGQSTIAPTITVDSGAHQIQLAVNLIDDTTITVAPSASLTLNNQIDLGGHTLTTTGGVSINHSTIGGGAVVSLGALATSGSTSIGGDLVSMGTLSIGADENGSDVFNVLGDATLSGTLDVNWSPASLPGGTMTVLTASGTLDASGLSLAANDARSFALGTDGNNLTLTFLGVAVPEPCTIGLLLFSVIGFLGSHRVRFGNLCIVKTAVVCFAALLFTETASAVNFDFENPPYTPGTLLGQNGWETGGYILADPFFGGTVNGTVDVSASSPISGSQSLLYTQTTVPAGAGVSGGSDVGNRFAVFAVKDGTTAIDLTASVQIRTDNNSIGDGSAGFFLGRGGGSPIFFRIDNANSTNGTGGIIIGDGGTVPSVGSYTPNNTYEFRFGVDVDNQQYEVFAKNLTAGTPEVNLTAGLPDGRATFFGGAGFPSDGDGQTFTFDSSVMLRSGTARVDEITAVGDDFVQTTWVGGSGSWGQNTAWIPQLIPNAPTGNGQIAVFGSSIASPQTVFTNTTQTVNGLRFDNANKYAIAGGGSVALKSNTIGGTVTPTIEVVQGEHEMQLPVSLLNNTLVTTNASTVLDFNNMVSLGSNTLTTAGSGVVNLNVGVTGGGTISNSSILGTAGTTPIAANLNSTGTLQVDLGPANTDFFNITGDATLSGLLDVVLEPSFAPSGSYTVLTVSGTLNAGSLALDPSDSGQFSLGVVGKSLVLTVGGGLPGDFDGDGDVDGRDFLVWQRGGTTPPLSLTRLGEWQSNYGAPSISAAATAVPEPSAVAIVVMSLSSLYLRFSRGRKRVPFSKNWQLWISSLLHSLNWRCVA